MALETLILDFKEQSFPSHSPSRESFLFRKSKKLIFLEVKNQSCRRLKYGLEWKDCNALMRFFLTLSDILFVL